MKYVIIFLSLFFISCSIKPDLKDVSVINKYLIPIANINHEEKDNTIIDKNVKISYVVAPKFLYSNHITYTKGDGIYGSYLYSFWEENPAKQIQFILSNAFSKVYKNVFMEPSQAKVDISVESKVEVFEYYLKENISEVRLKITLFLIDLQDFKVIKSREFYVAKEVKNKNPKGIVLGYEKIAKELHEKILKWLKS